MGMRLKAPAAGFRRLGAAPAALALAAMLSAPSDAAASMDDPFEPANRLSHAGNLMLDRFIAKPLSEAYGFAVPDAVAGAVQRVSSNLALPSSALNHFLQLELSRGVQTTMRFAVNSTVGVAGIFDVATEFGLDEDHTNFGTTLYRTLGLGSGPYIVMPAFGPSNVRDGIGFFVDAVANPLYWTLEPAGVGGIATFNAIATVGKRHENAQAIDPIFYGSEDSYAQLRLYYGQNRKFELGGGVPGEDYLDPYIGTGEIYEELFDPYGD